MAQQEQELLTRLAMAQNLPDAASAVQELERKLLYTWRPVGDNEGNYGLINIDSNQGVHQPSRSTPAYAGIT